MDRSRAAERLLCAIDTTDLEKAGALASSLEGHVGAIKLGLEFFCAHGPEGVRAVAGKRHDFFLDLKLHDIPNTVAGAVRALVPMRPRLVTVHASGGSAMMRAAMEAAHEAGETRPDIVGVTMLTSLDDDDIEAVGMHGSLGDQVLRLADLAQSCGLDGVVCSPHETERLRRHCGPDFVLVVPGIRPSRTGTDDQKRVMTPSRAMAAGASYLVVGRPITQAADPVEAARGIVDDMAAG